MSERYCITYEYLTNTENGANKFYALVAVEDTVNKKYMIFLNWGKRGSSGRISRNEFRTLGELARLFNDTSNKKSARGYQLSGARHLIHNDDLSFALLDIAIMDANLVNEIINEFDHKSINTTVLERRAKNLTKVAETFSAPKTSTVDKSFGMSDDPMWGSW